MKIISRIPQFSCLNLQLKYDNQGKLHTPLYDKREDFDYTIVLTQKLLLQQFVFHGLKLFFEKFYGRPHDLVDCYTLSGDINDC